MFRPSLVSFILLVPSFTLAVNDWTTPCLKGSCSYETPTLSNGPQGIVHINGSSTAISDLTPAAGWEILDCNENTAAQDIRIVCVGQNSTCSHLYQNGAVDTIVRLPENCGTMPFARVAAEWEHSDQTVPEHIAQKFSRRDGEPASSVRGVSLDTNFHEADATRHGGVSLAIEGGYVQNAQDAVPTGVNHARAAAVQPTQTMLASPQSTISYAGSSETILHHSENCYENGLLVPIGITANVSSTVQGSAQYNIVIKGALSPPTIDSFTLTNTLNANITGSVSMESAAVLSTSGNITLYDSPIKGVFQINGIVSIVPRLTVDATAIVNLNANIAANIGFNYNIDIAANIGFNYNIEGAVFDWPPTSKPNGLIQPLNHNLSITADPTAENLGTSEFHLRPQLSFDIGVFTNAQQDKTIITTSMDISNTLNLSLDPNPLNGCVELSSGMNVTRTMTSAMGQVWSKFPDQVWWQGEYTAYDQCGSHTKRRHARDVDRSFKRRDPNEPSWYACLGAMSDQKVAVANGIVYGSDLLARPISQ